MTGADRRYSPPEYQPAAQATWYHFLFGHIPGYQFDFIIQPKTNQTIKNHHIAWIRPLLTQIDPSSFELPAIAIGNLSLYDEQEKPGRGAVALLYGVRFSDLTDHAGRPGAFFCHAALAIGRELRNPLFAQACEFFIETVESAAAQFFRSYYRDGSEVRNGEIKPVGETTRIGSYLRNFADMPSVALVEQSTQTFDTDPTQGQTWPSRLIFVCPDRMQRRSQLEAAAAIASILHRSKVPWVWITVDLVKSIPVVPEGDPQQLVIHFVSEWNCPPQLRASLERTQCIDLTIAKDPSLQLVTLLKLREQRLESGSPPSSTTGQTGSAASRTPTPGRSSLEHGLQAPAQGNNVEPIPTPISQSPSAKNLNDLAALPTQQVQSVPRTPTPPKVQALSTQPIQQTPSTPSTQQTHQTTSTPSTPSTQKTQQPLPTSDPTPGQGSGARSDWSSLRILLWILLLGVVSAVTGMLTLRIIHYSESPETPDAAQRSASTDSVAKVQPPVVQQRPPMVSQKHPVVQQKPPVVQQPVAPPEPPDAPQTPPDLKPSDQSPPAVEPPPTGETVDPVANGNNPSGRNPRKKTGKGGNELVPTQPLVHTRPVDQEPAARKQQATAKLAEQCEKDKDAFNQYIQHLGLYGFYRNWKSRRFPCGFYIKELIETFERNCKNEIITLDEAEQITNKLYSTTGDPTMQDDQYCKLPQAEAEMAVGRRKRSRP